MTEKHNEKALKKEKIYWGGLNMVVWRRPCSDGEIIEAMENVIVANCTLGFFVSGLPSTNTVFRKMKLNCCVDLFLFFSLRQPAIKW